MGSDPQRSVTDPRNRLWSVPNVLVTDEGVVLVFPNGSGSFLAPDSRAWDAAPGWGWSL